MTSTLRISVTSLVAGSLLVLAGHALAATPANNARAACDGVKQDRAACLREIGAAAQAARQGGLAHASDDVYRQNALARCQRQPAEERQACEDRVLGTGRTTIQGDVMGGGLLRETVTTIPAGR